MKNFAWWNHKGRVYIERANADATIVVRMDWNDGKRSPERTAAVAELDFSAPDGWR